MHRYRKTFKLKSLKPLKPLIGCPRPVHTYSPASSHVQAIQRIVGEGHILVGESDMEPYKQDWTRTYAGGSLVCFPQSVVEVSELLKYCNANKIGVVPQGGNTGLVGGAVGTSKEELILSLKRMNRVLELDASAGVVTCEAGCVLELLNSEVAKQGFAIPLDLGAKGSCMIGGNVATNAGGLRVMKYGSLQGNVLGLEVVLADGTVLDMLRTLRKDNCGLHSKHLFVGSEGTLGVITKISLLLVAKPTYSTVLFAKVILHIVVVGKYYLRTALQSFSPYSWRFSTVFL
jgi:D-2-hydroxyglutarate dehydrogenase